MKATTIGLDLAKHVFQVHGEDERGEVVVRKKLTRAKVIEWFAPLPPAQVGIEACGGAHYWARELSALGHAVKILPPQYVKPFVKTNKNDAVDAAALCRAVRERDLRPVPMATPEQQDLQAVHRVRQRLLESRTRLCNQTRGLLLEYGVALPKGVAQLRTGLKHLLASAPVRLSGDLLQLLQEQYSELLGLDEKIAQYTRRLEERVEHDERGQRLLGIPGVGKLTGAALLGKLASAQAFRNGRHFAASLGLVPRHEGTGGKVRLLGISKRGDRYVRSLLIHGARAVFRHLGEKSDPVSQWLRALVARRGVNKAVVALANKNARIVWALLAHGGRYCPRQACGGLR